MKNEIEKWIEKAERDLVASKINMQQGLYDISAFLSHQAAEKALKTLYILKFNRLWKTHDLVGLLVKIKGDKTLLKLCDELNDHYIKTRYPSDVEYTKGTAQTAINKSEKVVLWVKQELSKK